MKVSNKLLHHYEQSMLLVAMLFSRKQLDDILALFPDEQMIRIEAAKDRFLRLEKSERITQIILELRRLLLAKENKIAWIHQSWIDDELLKEPPYLRVLLGEALAGIDSPNLPIPRSLLIQSFLPSIINSPPKTALFDPVLMRLQALNERNLEKVMSAIGVFALSLLASSLDTLRFKKFIAKKYPSIELARDPQITENPFNQPALRSALVQRLIGTFSLSNLEEIGLFMVASYLSFHKVRWHRAIELALPKNIGLDLRGKIAEFAQKTLEPGLRSVIAIMLINAMEEAFI